MGIVGLCDAGKIELLSSEVLLYEIKCNPKIVRREFGLEILSKAADFIEVSKVTERRAREIEEVGIKPLDALHLASAEEIDADYFCTCDDRFLKKAKRLPDLKLKAVSPLELVEELENVS